MKLSSILLLSLISLISCGQNRAQDQGERTIQAYYKAYNDKNYGVLQEFIAPDIQLFEDDALVVDTKSAFMDLVRWGQVFGSHNELVSVRRAQGGWVCEEVQKSERITFLFGRNLRAETYFYVKAGQIQQIKCYLKDFAPERDLKKYNQFVGWVKEKRGEFFPELLELNQKGAQQFKKEMKAYQEQE